jgi:predicted RNA-binding Zn-ribbon protein involved in translation (DUF1610 family)
MTITECPKCGNDEYYQKGKASGLVVVNSKFSPEDDDLVDNCEMYTDVDYVLGKTKWCNNCGTKIKEEVIRYKCPYCSGTKILPFMGLIGEGQKCKICDKNGTISEHHVKKHGLESYVTNNSVDN